MMHINQHQSTTVDTTINHPCRIIRMQLEVTGQDTHMSGFLMMSHDTKNIALCAGESPLCLTNI